MAKCKHGMATRRNNKTPEYRAWHDMKDRCYNFKNPQYARYGGRGIEVCNRWLNSFENFYKDMGAKPIVQGGRRSRYSLERRDNDGSYTKENCYWATIDEQTCNRHNSHFETHKGITRTFIGWTRHLGVSDNALRYWLNKGCSFSEVVEYFERKKCTSL